MMDPLAPLLNLADVESALKSARAAVDGAYRHRALRRKGGQVAAEIGLRSAVASAALSGAAFDLEDVRAGTVLDPLVQGALRVYGELRHPHAALGDRATAGPRAAAPASGHRCGACR
jgi:2-keto-3-deoxy-6-phosphogluconate aldolase